MKYEYQRSEVTHNVSAIIGIIWGLIVLFIMFNIWSHLFAPLRSSHNSTEQPVTTEETYEQPVQQEVPTEQTYEQPVQQGLTHEEWVQDCQAIRDTNPEFFNQFPNHCK